MMSDRTFFRCFRELGQASEVGRVEFGLVKTANADLEKVKLSLTQNLPSDVSVYKKSEFIRRSKQFWAESKAVGKVFGLGILIGFLIGMTICYQILYSSVVDRWPQYATLKAMGYGNGFLARVVLVEAVTLAVSGFVPGLCFSRLAYMLLQQKTNILMNLTSDRILPVLMLTILMCTIAGFMAVVKSMRADPAELFQ